MRVKDRKDEAAAQRPTTAIEGNEAVELYTRQISFNLSDLEKQVELLRAECVKARKLLREVE